MTTIYDKLRFNSRGLIPAVAQQFDTKEVLMMAWMSRDSIEQTLATGHVTYYSRSRHSLWRKGESSGQTQRLVDMRLDCDGDALLLLVDQVGVACHTGRHSCFYRAQRHNELEEILQVEVTPEKLYGKKKSV